MLNMEDNTMTIRELLSCMMEEMAQRITLRDKKYREISLHIRFTQDGISDYWYKEDMETLEFYADCKINKWFIRSDGHLVIYIDEI